MHFINGIKQARKKYISNKYLKYIGYFFDASLITAGFVTSILFPPAAMICAGIALTAVSFKNYAYQREVLKGANPNASIAVGYNHVMMISTVFLSLVILGPILGPAAPVIPAIWGVSIGLVVVSALAAGGYNKLREDWLESKARPLIAIITLIDSVTNAFTKTIDYLGDILYKTFGPDPKKLKISAFKSNSENIDDLSSNDNILSVVQKPSTLLKLTLIRFHNNAGVVLIAAQQIAFIATLFLAPPLGIAGLLFTGINLLRVKNVLPTAIATRVENLNTNMEFISGFFIPNFLMQAYTVYKIAAVSALKLVLPGISNFFLGNKKLSGNEPIKSNKISRNISREKIERIANIIETLIETIDVKSLVFGEDFSNSINTFNDKRKEYKKERHEILEDKTGYSKLKEWQQSTRYVDKIKYTLLSPLLKVVTKIAKYISSPIILRDFLNEIDKQFKLDVNLDHCSETLDTIPEPKLDYKRFLTQINKLSFTEVAEVFLTELQLSAKFKAIDKHHGIILNKKLLAKDEQPADDKVSEEEYNQSVDAVFKILKIKYNIKQDAPNHSVVAPYFKSQLKEICKRIQDPGDDLWNQKAGGHEVIYKRATLLLEHCKQLLDSYEQTQNIQNIDSLRKYYKDNKKQLQELFGITLYNELTINLEEYEFDICKQELHQQQIEAFSIIKGLVIDAGDHCATALYDVINQLYDQHLMTKIIDNPNSDPQQKYRLKLQYNLRGFRKNIVDQLYSICFNFPELKIILFHMDMLDRHDRYYIMNALSRLNIDSNNYDTDLSNDNIDILKEITSQFLSTVIIRLMSSSSHGYSTNGIFLQLLHEYNSPAETQTQEIFKIKAIIPDWLESFKGDAAPENPALYPHGLLYDYIEDLCIDENPKTSELIIALILYDAGIFVPTDPKINKELEMLLSEQNSQEERKTQRSYFEKTCGWLPTFYGSSKDIQNKPTNITPFTSKNETETVKLTCG